jgi:hypothetical protein
MRGPSSTSRTLSFSQAPAWIASCLRLNDDLPSQYSIVSKFQHSQARIKAAELDRTATERRAATAEREVVALRRQLEEAAADTEEAVQGALAEAHEAFDAEVGRLPVPPRGACRLLRASVSGPLILVWHDRTAWKLNYAEIVSEVFCSVYHRSSYHLEYICLYC